VVVLVGCVWVVEFSEGFEFVLALVSLLEGAAAVVEVAFVVVLVSYMYRVVCGAAFTEACM
jgi:hypothetical protein